MRRGTLMKNERSRDPIMEGGGEEKQLTCVVYC